jgi:hypothetical protein
VIVGGLSAQRFSNALCDLLAHLIVRIDQQNAELVAAITRQNIGGPRIFFHHTRQEFQSPIPRQVAEPVIDLF